MIDSRASRIDWNKRFAEASRMVGGPKSRMGMEVNSNPSYAGEPVSGTTNTSVASKVTSAARSVATTAKNAGSKVHAEVKTWKLGEWGSLASICGIALWAYDQFTPGGLRGNRK